MAKRLEWWEEYACGCISESVPRKKDLAGYCGIHGDDRVNVYRGGQRKPTARATERGGESDG